MFAGRGLVKGSGMGGPRHVPWAGEEEENVSSKLCETKMDLETGALPRFTTEIL